MHIMISVLLTYVCTYLVDVCHALSVCKDLADRGLKLNTSSSEVFASFTYYRYIPFINFLNSSINFCKYYFNSNNLISGFILKGLVTEMNVEELKSYKNDSTSLNAFVLIFRSLNKEKNEINSNEEKLNDESFVIENQLDIDDDNIIYYEMNVKNPDGGFKIISSKGEISKLNNDELLDIVIEYYDELDRRIEEYIEKYYDGNREKFERDIFIDGKIDLEQLKENIKLDYVRDVAIKSLRKKSE